MTPDEFRRRTGASVSVMAGLSAYAALLVKWQAKINLVGRSTLPDLWRRHMLDSAQLMPLLPHDTRVLIDLGSGAGFPGLVLAIMGVPQVRLIESDVRKGAFLREVIRATGAPATVHTGRIEGYGEQGVADVVTARALAPLDVLVDYAAPLLKPGGVCLFLKGRKAQEELTRCANRWNIAPAWEKSLTDPSGAILKIGRIDKKNAD
ncbi:MAG: 16S rRNA (guanine(527)-N(7))-methyltransferase RsmG [Rhodospirillales bacterium]|nr:16S rRNA (guanine(527)-N(7))-methyltransferase RsmG [Rhodospirillales bacterium]